MRTRAWPALLATAATLAACGGGGGADGGPATDAAVAPEPARSTALAGRTAPEGFDFSSLRTLAAVRSSDVAPDPGAFADPARTYVAFWTDAPDGSRRQIAFLSLAALRALDGRGGLQLRVPLDAGPVRYEVYDAATAMNPLRGELRA